MNRIANTVNPCLVDAIELEMDRTWAEAHEDDYARRRCDEDELLDRHPLFANAADCTLIEVVALAAAGDCIDDELVAVAAIVLERRLTAGA